MSYLDKMQFYVHSMLNYANNESLLFETKVIFV